MHNYPIALAISLEIFYLTSRLSWAGLGGWINNYKRIFDLITSPHSSTDRTAV